MSLKPEVREFIIWSMKPENKVFVKKASYQRIADAFNEETGYHVCHTIVPNHRNRWILVNGEPYEIAKIPPFILKNEKFRSFAKENDIDIEEF